MKHNRCIITYILLVMMSMCFIGCGKSYDSTNLKNEKSIQMDDETADNSANNLRKSKADETPAMKKPETTNGNIGKRVVCYGDSLTEGTGGDGITWPGTVEAISGATVLNYGVYGEASSCIAARQGGNPQGLNEEIVVPSDCTPVNAQFSGKYGWEMLLVFGDAGINNCTLGGIEGTYAMDEDGRRVFTRLEPGEETVLPEGTPLITKAMLDKQPDDIMVIYAGSNDTLETTDDIPLLVQKINEMITYHGNDKYVVVSLTSRHERIPIVDDVNSALENEFGSHYLDLRQYMVYEAINQLGIEPTNEDNEAINAGDVPFSLRVPEDPNHGNSDFYRLAGEQIYKKLVELGYLD